MDNIYAAITVCRQVDGEYIFIKTDKAFRSAQKADALIKTLKAQFVTDDGKWKPQVISTAQGDATCQCEAGIFELELDET